MSEEARKPLIDWADVRQRTVGGVILAVLVGGGGAVWTTISNEPRNRAPELAAGSSTSAQKVRWGPIDRLPAGIRVWGDEKSREQFVPWPDLERELREKLLPQLFADPTPFKLVVQDFYSKKDWVIKILMNDENMFCWLWFGANPANGWQWDGLIRIGLEGPHVLQTYQRFSDGSYRRIQGERGPLNKQCGESVM